MTQWEYKELFLHRRISLSEPNEEGARGWELCDHTQGDYTFKRPIPQLSPSEKIFDDVLKEVDPGHMQVKTTS